SNDGVDGPLAASTCQTGVSKNHQEREPSMSEITTIGLDLAKHVFQVHGIDAQGTTVLRKRLRRGQVLAFFSRIPRCVVGLEACATAHYWGRELGALGHEVRLMPAQYVKAYIKRNKHDAADAEAICEAVERPTMRFVPVKTAEQQATALLHRGREQLVRQRTMLVNALRAHLAEFGIVAARGLRNVGQLIAIVRDDADIRLPPVAQQVLQVLASQLEQIEAAVAALERQLLTWHKTNPVSQRLASIPGITRDGTVGRSDATERSLPFHWDIDPARVMRPRFADPIRASSPSGLREQAGLMTASDLCAARQMISRLLAHQIASLPTVEDCANGYRTAALTPAQGNELGVD